MRRLLLALALGVATAGHALAQDRSPALRQSLIDLSYVLGEAHALRQACQGLQDQYWRSQMSEMMRTEQPDETLERRLRESFNTGFATRQGQFPVCTPGARRAEAAAMARGRILASRLAQASRERPATEGPPDDVADPSGPR